MAYQPPALPAASLQADDPFDATLGAIGSVVRREPNRDWAIVDLVNRRYHILAYAIAGRAHYRCAGRDFDVSQGQLLYFPKGMAHSGRSDPDVPWAFYSASFELEFADAQVEAAYEALPSCVTPRSVSELRGLFNDLQRLWVAREPGYLLRCRGILLELLHIHVRCCYGIATAVPHARKLAPIVTLLQENQARTFSIEELAEMAELSPSRFRVLFRQYTGHSVVRYQNWLRINKAKDLLLSGEYTVTEAAEEAGFVDVYYFSRLFKKLTGFNPSYFRNQ
jgi:AraC-like DNA-binding protein